MYTNYYDIMRTQLSGKLTPTHKILHKYLKSVITIFSHKLSHKIPKKKPAILLNLKIFHTIESMHSGILASYSSKVVLVSLRDVSARQSVRLALPAPLLQCEARAVPRAAAAAPQARADADVSISNHSRGAPVLSVFEDFWTIQAYCVSLCLKFKVIGVEIIKLERKICFDRCFMFISLLLLNLDIFTLMTV